MSLPTPSGTPSASTADLVVPGATARLYIGDFAGRYSHVDWEREQQVEPTRHATIRYILLGRSLALSNDFYKRFPSH